MAIFDCVCGYLISCKKWGRIKSKSKFCTKNRLFHLLFRNFTYLRGVKKRDSRSRRFRLAARTHASHAWNTGSIPVGATSRRHVPVWGVSFFLIKNPLFHLLFPYSLHIFVVSNKFFIILKRYMQSILCYLCIDKIQLHICKKDIRLPIPTFNLLR